MTERVLISAHRGADGGLQALVAHAGSGVDYVELDIRRTRDGVFVVVHDADVAGGGRRLRVREADHAELADVAAAAGRPLLTLQQCLQALDGRVGIHADLKVTSPPGLLAGTPGHLEAAWDVQAARLVLDGAGARGALFTAGSGEVISRLRGWTTGTGRSDVRVGLSVGRSLAGLGVRRAALALREDLFPAARVAACGANLLVPQKELALLTLARWGRRHRVPVLVWTVDTDVELAHWLTPGRAWMVTTNRPATAMEIAAERRRPAS